MFFSAMFRGVVMAITVLSVSFLCMMFYGCSAHDGLRTGIMMAALFELTDISHHVSWMKKEE